MLKIIKEKEIILYLILSILFAITIQQFPFFKGNSLHLLHAIKDFDSNKLQEDWIANQTNHLPAFTYLNGIILQVFPVNILYAIHFSLLVICSLFIFLICKNEFQNLNKISLSLIWFSVFILIYNEHSFFGGLAGQDIINEGYQPASFGVLFYCGIYLYLTRRYFYAVLLICLSASFHPSYVIHSGFLLFGFFIYFFSIKEFKLLFKVLSAYIILILPITIYIILNFLLIDKDLSSAGQLILLERIPHHALISNWFSYKDLLSILVYLLALFLVRKNNKFFIPFFVFGFLSILLSSIQFLTQNQSLALAFPWRASVFLIPLSSMILISFLINNLSSKKINLDIIGLVFFLIIFSFFSIKNHFTKNINQNFYTKLELTREINKNYNFVERILIPIDLSYIRMNTGLPIFIDWKHHAFKYNELIKWEKRINLANQFYETTDFDKQKIILEDINRVEKISHILINKNQLRKDCDNLIDHRIYALINANACYK